jgi:CRISPR-associated protein Cmr2
MKYNAITFAPVQGFIEKSRKLRDLYGSSFILSFLAKTICNYAADRGAKVIVPGQISGTKGVPNNIYLTGNIDEAGVRTVFDRAWRLLVDTCREYIECEYLIDRAERRDRALPWQREWKLCANYTWELFVICGAENESLDSVRRRMSERKQSRDWIGVNWRGESSTLAGADAIAYPNMTAYHPVNSPNPDLEIKEFYQFLSRAMPELAIEARERLSIPELIKRLITYNPVRQKIDEAAKQSSDNYLAQIEKLESFSEINRWEDARWTGWFQGDGDRMGVYISDKLTNSTQPAQNDRALSKFSEDMLNWGHNLQQNIERLLENRLDGRIVYAGGDDFFGVLYRNPDRGDRLTPHECLEHFWYKFDDLWNQCQHDISVSTGFVWAAPNVPQRDLLQHLRETEKTAKTEGRDRLAIRILFNSGNYLDWSCPWRWLQPILTGYRDRQGDRNWTHIYRDIATLEARHAFTDDDPSVARGIFEIYFPNLDLEAEDRWWTAESADSSYHRLASGLLGKRPSSERDRINRRNQWTIALAKVGFHLFS